jgi:hypothetical protein
MDFIPGVTLEQANAPRPVKPEWYAPQWKWDNYFVDLACWKATQAERLMYGIRPD